MQFMKIICVNTPQQSEVHTYNDTYNTRLIHTYKAIYNADKCILMPETVLNAINITGSY